MTSNPEPIQLVKAASKGRIKHSIVPWCFELFGDKWSLGFVAETEKQVVKHLEGHLQQLPTADHKSQTILEQMRDDEGRHATVAIESGGAELPEPVRQVMRCTSKIMTRTAYGI